MKKNILFLLFAFFFTSAFAQVSERSRSPRENIEVLKVAYFTKHLSLTTEEAEKFWPLYNAYFTDVRKARQENKEDIIAFEEAVLNIRKRYKGELKKILATDERVNKALVAEREFMNVVRKELQQRVEKRKKMYQEKTQQKSGI